jgi:membrane protease subunit HflK
VPVKHVYEVAVGTLAPNPGAEDEYYSSSLDPITQGYALTGDQNIVHASVVARYRVRDAAEWAFYGPNADDVLRVEVTAAVVRSLGEIAVDRVLADGRKDLIADATARAQAGLDACHAGLEPPAALAADFTAVQSAFIGAETKRKEAQAFAEGAIPQAQAQADTATQAARGAADADIARARGEAGAFVALEHEYRLNPAVVRERLYRDAVERAISASSSVRWVPPPVGGKYERFRITVPSTAAPPVSAGEDEDR